MNTSIVVIDRFPVVRKGLHLLFSGYLKNITIQEFDTVKDFFGSDQQFAPDLIILGSTSQTTRQNEIRLTKIYFDTSKIILFDENPDYSLIISYIRAGLNGYISKPTGLTELKMCVDAVMRGKIFLSAEAVELPDPPSVSIKKRSQVVVLSSREQQIAEYLIMGLRTSAIAERLDRKPSTISTIKKAIFSKLKVNTVIDLCDVLR